MKDKAKNKQTNKQTTTNNKSIMADYVINREIVRVMSSYLPKYFDCPPPFNPPSYSYPGLLFGLLTSPYTPSSSSSSSSRFVSVCILNEETNTVKFEWFSTTDSFFLFDSQRKCSELGLRRQEKRIKNLKFGQLWFKRGKSKTFERRLNDVLTLQILCLLLVIGQDCNLSPKKISLVEWILNKSDGRPTYLDLTSELRWDRTHSCSRIFFSGMRSSALYFKSFETRSRAPGDMWAGNLRSTLLFQNIQNEPAFPTQISLSDTWVGGRTRYRQIRA